MKISLVMATYNGEKYLIEQMNSLLNQTRKIDQVVIVDDCSSDQTKSIVLNYIQEHSLKHWTFYENETNIGFKKNFKKGLSLVDGDIVFLCDQDDDWYTNKIEVMSQIMSQDSTIKALASSFTFINEKNETFTINQIKGKSNQNLLPFECADKEMFKVPFNFLIKENFAQGCCLAVTKEIVYDYQTGENNDLPHDWYLLLLATSQESCFFYNEALIHYRIHQNNTIGLGSVITNERVQSRSHRVNNRLQVLIEEQNIFKSISDYQKITRENKYIYEQHAEWMQLRIECLKDLKLFKLITSYVFRSKKGVYNIRAFAGDILAIIKIRRAL